MSWCLKVWEFCLSKGHEHCDTFWGWLGCSFFANFLFQSFLNSLHCWKDEVSLSCRKLVVGPNYWVNGFISLHQCPCPTAAGWSRTAPTPCHLTRTSSVTIQIKSSQRRTVECCIIAALVASGQEVAERKWHFHTLLMIHLTLFRGNWFWKQQPSL